MKNTQYTVRNISPKTDAAIRARALRQHKSLNQTLVDILEQAAAGQHHKHKQTTHHDFDDLFGSWVDDPDFDEAMKDVRKVDPEDWR
jgi:plasmid stability protein